MKIIECTDLRKEYPNGIDTVKAVDGISVSFEQGEFCAITGQSGSGKSTLLHILSSLDTPTDGAVFFDGKNLAEYNDNQLSVLRRRRFGFVFQSYNLVGELNGYENIVLPVMLDRKKPDMQYIDKIVSSLGIEDRLFHLPSAMSGGQQQRIAIARALSNKPSVLFADEPTGNLDGASGREVISLLRYVAEEFGITLILVTHDIHVAEQADRIVTLHDGKIIRDTKAGDMS